MYDYGMLMDLSARNCIGS